jgi:hypothetical protein
MTLRKKLEELDNEILSKIMKFKKVNFSALSRKYGLSWNTVKRHCRDIMSNTQKETRKARKCFLSNIGKEIEEMISDTSVTIKSIYMYFLNIYDIEELRSYSNFRKYVKLHYGDLRKESTLSQRRVRYEVAPGEQLQYDWIEGLKIHLKDGTLITFNIWSATLGYSRKHVYLASPTKTEEDVKRCFLDTIIILGGIPKEALTDNMSSIVDIKDGRRHVHTSMTQFFKDLGIKDVYCKPRHPFTKGKVEVSNKYQNWLKVYDRKFKTVGELYNSVAAIMNQSNYQINETTKFPPNELFRLKEKELLKLLPIDIIKQYHKNLIPVKTDDKCLFNYDGATYSVPYLYNSKKIFVMDEKEFIYLYNINMEPIMVHEKHTSGIHYEYSHYASMANRNKHESQENYEKRINNNLERLAKVGSLSYLDINNEQ